MTGSADHFNPLRPKCHYSGFVITSQHKNYNLHMLWPITEIAKNTSADIVS